MANSLPEEIISTTPKAEKEDDNIELNISQPEPRQNSEVNSIVEVATQESDILERLDDENITLCKNNKKELTRLIRSIAGLTHFQKRVIELRYISLIDEYEKRLTYIDTFYHISRSLVSIGSVAVPALLSIQSPTGSFSVWLFWITWTISLSVTVCHNFTTIFRFDKKFFGLHSTLEKLKSEGWQYLELTGNYSGHYGHVSPTHVNQYVYFLNKIERIKLKQVEEEYNAIKESDKHTQNQSGQGQGQTQQNPKEVIPSPLDLKMNRGKKTLNTT
jgi:hypothetical protein